MLSSAPFVAKEGCLSDSDAGRLAAGVVSAEERAAFDAHLEGCVECRDLVAALASDGAALVGTASMAPEKEKDERPLAEGTLVGRFRVGTPLGRGAMGAVYRAHDPQLDREVALKLLAPGTGVRPESWLQEGRAQAKLSHPNVVGVFEAFTWEDRVVLALELVEGRTLRQWLRDEHPTWRRVLEVFLAAGEGLEAAHRAGIVHRDFKPDNVLVGHDGRVRVSDFGLAASNVIGVTASGTVVGTPAYMAPEQLDGLVVDARADQFAFCVSLVEALYGKRPFEGATLSGLRASIRRGPTPEPPSSTVPAWVWRRILPGLADAPTERYPNQGALLASLRRDPWRTALRIAAPTVAIVVALSGWSPWSRPDPAARCLGEGDAELAAQWSADTQGALRAAFAGRGSSADVATRDLDAWASRWRDAWGAHCRRAVNSASADTPLTARCLHRGVLEFTATVSLLSHSGPSAVPVAAWSALDALPDAQACLRRFDSTRALEPPTGDAPQRLAGAIALLRTGAVQEAKAQLEHLAAEADATPAGRAEVLGQLAQTLRELGDVAGAEQQLIAALRLAAEAGDTEQVARLWVERIAVVGRKPDGLAQMERFLEVAQLGVLQAGNAPELQAALLGAQAQGLLRHRKPADARLVLERALKLRADAGLTSGPQTETLTADLAVALRDVGQGLAATAEGERAVGLRAARLGETHPLLAPLLSSLSASYRAIDRHADAVAAARREVTLLTAALGARHPAVQSARLDLANALWENQDVRGAQAEVEAALEVLRPLPNEWLRTAKAMNLLGICAQLQGASEQAITQWSGALELLEAKGGTGQMLYALVVGNLGGALMERRENARAEAVLQKALTVAKEGQETLAPLRILSELSTVQQQAGRPAEALVTIDRVIAQCEQTPERRCGGLHGNRGRILVDLGRFDEAVLELDIGIQWDPKDTFDPQVWHFYRARARWELGARADAVAEARAARSVLASTGQRGEFWVRDLDAWLARHGGGAQ